MNANAQQFNSLKEQGNQLLKKTRQDYDLSPTVYQQRMCQSLMFYNKALNFAASAKDKSSIYKNMAITQQYIGERLLVRSKSSVSPSSTSRINKPGTQMEKDIEFFLEESLKHFEMAAEVGKGVQDLDWIKQIEERHQQCAELLWSALVFIFQDLSEMFGRLHKLCWNLSGTLRAHLFLKLGHLTFLKAVDCQETNKVIQSLQLLHDNHLNIEEAKKLPPFQLEEVLELEDNTYTHLCIGESAMIRQRGDQFWHDATNQEEELQMDLVWDAVDCYLHSVISSRGKCLESEAIAHSHLGRLYEVLSQKEKSREHYKMAVELALAMQPKNFNAHLWYKQALAGLEKYQQQQQWAERKEMERIRAPIREELKDVLEELKATSKRGSQALLDLIYVKHPPKRGEKSADSNMKTKLKFALLHYHPDKQDVEVHGLKWMVLAEEITSLLTHHYTCHK